MGYFFFKGLCLLFLTNVPRATFIQGTTFIPESRVRYKWGCAYSSCQNFQGLRLFKGLRLFLTLEYCSQLILSLAVIKGGSNRALACLGTEKLIDYLFMVSGLCGGSWICHILYYKYMGHPWTEINGPQIKR